MTYILLSRLPFPEIYFRFLRLALQFFRVFLLVYALCRSGCGIWFTLIMYPEIKILLL